MTTPRSALAALLLCSSSLAWAQLPGMPTPGIHPAVPVNAAAQQAPAGPPPVVPQCSATMPALRSPLAFAPGEQFDFDLDAMGATAGRLSIQVQKKQEGALPVQVQIQTNTFFSKVRRVNATAVSYIHPKTLRTSRYTEDSTENEVRRTVDVSFNAKNHSARVDSTLRGTSSRSDLPYEYEGLDAISAIYMMRQLPMKEGMPVCFDVYGVRRMWRLTGSVLKREHVSLPLGEFEAWHLAGVAARLDRPSATREVHVWISDDDRRLPLALLGSIDLGAVRATLTSITRPGEKAQQAVQGKEQLKW